MDSNWEDNGSHPLVDRKDTTVPNSVEAISRLPHLEKYRDKKPFHAFENKQKRAKLKYALLFSFFLLFLLVWIYYSRPLFFLETYHPCIYLKAPSPDFVGRDFYLHRLSKELKSILKEEKFKHDIMVRELWGKGGFGKSELAIEFANRHLHDFSLIWTFYCDTLEHLEQGYRHLAEKLEIYVENDSFEKMVKKVHLYLENCSLRLPWLLIFDNVETPFVNYPERGGMIIVTSQKKVVNHDCIVEIHPFTQDETIELLEKITHNTRDEAMLQLASDLEGVPLLVNYAAHYIKTTPGCTVADYQKLFSSHFLGEESPLWKGVDVNQRYFNKSLAASWQFPLESLKKEHPEALEWLFLCGYLYPESICEEWIDIWLEGFFSQNKDILKIKRKEILKSLLNLGIIRYEQATKTFSLHRFLQQMLREARRDQKEEDLAHVLTMLVKSTKNHVIWQSLSWKQEKFWYLHACEISRWLNSFPHENSKIIDAKEEANLYEGMAYWGIINNEQYTEALETNYKVLKLRQSALPQNAPEIGVAYENIAEVLYKMSRYSEALAACRQAQQILEPYRAEKPLENALALNMEGLIFWEMGEYEKGLKAHRDALAIRTRELGSSNYHVGYSLNNAALCLRDLGRYDEALELCEKALKVYESVDIDHPWYVWALQNKGWIYFYQNQTSKALKIFQQALSSDILIRGENHVGLAYSYNGIGWCYLRLERFSRAKKVFKKCLKLGMLNEGTQARLVIRIYKGLMWTYLKNGQFEKAFRFGALYLHESAEVYQNNPKTVIALQDFKQALIESLERGISEAQLETASREAFAISNKTLGKNHALTRFFQKHHVVSSSSQKKANASKSEERKSS